MRGFSGGTSARNGLVRDGYDHGVSMADVERVEILTGLSGFLYGAYNVGGMINYVTKRPTFERYNSVTLGNTSGTNMYIHGDFGGRIDDDGRFGYRINLLTQRGETAVEHQDAEKDFASIALDWQATDSLLLQVDASHRKYHLTGRQAYWSLASDDSTVTGSVVRPDAKDIASDKLWGQKWSDQYTETDRLGANLSWEINENISFRAAYLDEEISRNAALSFNKTHGDNTYSQNTKTNKDAPHTMTLKSMFAFLDVSFTTGSIEHTVTTGVRYSENTQARYQDGWSQRHYLNEEDSASIPVPLTEPKYEREPVWDEHGTTSHFLWKWGVTNFTIGDDITFNEQWSALVGATFSKVYSETHNGGVYHPEATYKEDAVTPSLSLIYKPMDSVTIYASYMEGLENGSTVDEEEFEGRGVINVGEQLELLISNQVEIGAKAHVGGMLLTAAFFEIDKSLEYYDIINAEQVKVRARRSPKNIEV